MLVSYACAERVRCARRAQGVSAAAVDAPAAVKPLPETDSQGHHRLRLLIGAVCMLAFAAMLQRAVIWLAAHSYSAVGAAAVALALHHVLAPYVKIRVAGRA
jgi:hypothetical protein